MIRGRGFRVRGWVALAALVVGLVGSGCDMNFPIETDPERLCGTWEHIKPGTDVRVDRKNGTSIRGAYSSCSGDTVRVLPHETKSELRLAAVPIGEVEGIVVRPTGSAGKIVTGFGMVLVLGMFATLIYTGVADEPGSDR